MNSFIEAKYLLSTNIDEKMIECFVQQLFDYGCINDTIDFSIEPSDQSPDRIYDEGKISKGGLKEFIANLVERDYGYMEFSREYEFLSKNNDLDKNTLQGKNKLAIGLHFQKSNFASSGLPTITLDFLEGYLYDVSPKEVRDMIELAKKFWFSLEKISTPKYVYWSNAGTEDDVSTEVGRIGWLSIFPPLLTNQIGKEKLLQVPAWKVEEIAEDTVMIIVSETFDDSIYTTIEIANYLGAENGVLPWLKD